MAEQTELCRKKGIVWKIIRGCQQKRKIVSALTILLKRSSVYKQQQTKYWKMEAENCRLNFKIPDAAVSAVTTRLVFSSLWHNPGN